MKLLEQRKKQESGYCYNGRSWEDIENSDHFVTVDGRSRYRNKNNNLPPQIEFATLKYFIPQFKLETTITFIT